MFNWCSSIIFLASAYSDILNAIKQGSTNYTQALSDTISLTDLLIKQAAKNLLEQITPSDTLSINKGISKILTETIDLADSIGKRLSRTFSDALTLTDSIAQTLIPYFPRSIGNWILRTLYGRTHTIKDSKKSHILSTTRETYVVQLPQRTFTLSRPRESHIIKLNDT